MNHTFCRPLLGIVLIAAWSCNEESYIEPIRYNTVRG